MAKTPTNGRRSRTRSAAGTPKGTAGRNRPTSAVPMTSSAKRTARSTSRTSRTLKLTKMRPDTPYPMREEGLYLAGQPPKDVLTTFTLPPKYR